MAINPSPHLALLLLLMHAMAAAMAAMAGLPPVIMLAVFMLVLLSLLYYLARDALLLLPGSWRRISFMQGSILVAIRGGAGFSGRVLNQTVVSPYFAVLHVRPEGRRLPVFRVIFPDALESGVFRELCVQLKFGCRQFQ